MTGRYDPYDPYDPGDPGDPGQGSQESARDGGGPGLEADDLPWELGGTLGAPPEQDPDGVTRAPADGGWCVVVEVEGGVERRRPSRVVRVLEDGLATRELAQQAAERRAFDVEPTDPWSVQSREVYEDGAGFLTILTGATATFHFTTRAVRFAGVRDA